MEEVPKFPNRSRTGAGATLGSRIPPPPPLPLPLSHSCFQQGSKQSSTMIAPVRRE